MASIHASAAADLGGNCADLQLSSSVAEGGGVLMGRVAGKSKCFWFVWSKQHIVQKKTSARDANSAGSHKKEQKSRTGKIQDMD